ncbi:NAD(P)-binding protein [Natronoglycomyces albus]|uniref:Potassium channel family protein n=1 Tax=Natronoglycomyces albus TaxID=2811108 RepID=A0A895XIC7_9ACTN|nr:NAD(P)-binding protein [Natronoglycomyces albus]QSB05094.1 potassium channel family protein [Natronoglycomyces albus]
MNPGINHPELAAASQKVIVCGDSGLAYLLIEELTERHGIPVTVLLPSAHGSRRREIREYSQTSSLVTISERNGITDVSLQEAGLQDATAVALMNQDDIGNINMAMRIREVSRSLGEIPKQRNGSAASQRSKETVPGPKIIIRMYNQNLTDRIKALIGGDTVIMSDADLAAPTFVTAALGGLPPGDITIWGRRMTQSREREAEGSPSGEWPIASRRDDHLSLLPDDFEDCIRVLRLERETKIPWWRSRQSSARQFLIRSWEMARRVFDMKLRLTAVILLVIVIGGVWMLNHFDATEAEPENWWDALYIVTLTAAGGIDPDIEASKWTKLAHGVVAMSGALLIPVVTGAIVQALVTRRMSLDEGQLVYPIRGHVIVVGLGNVGTRVVQQLREQGVQVVAIDRNREATGVRAARQCGAHVLFGEAGQPEILEAAHIQSCKSLAALTSTDEANLEAALNGMQLKEDLHVALRIYESEMARSLREELNIRSSYSVPRVVAGAFAATMTEDTILETIPVRHQAIYICQVKIQGGSALDGAYAADVSEVEYTRLLAIRQPTGKEHWDPMANPAFSKGQPLRMGQTLLVLASKQGLNHLLSQSRGSASVMD